jgi:hypothetical protein
MFRIIFSLFKFHLEGCFGREAEGALRLSAGSEAAKAGMAGKAFEIH